jgi:menaquinone-9 beta-reductase
MDGLSRRDDDRRSALAIDRRVDVLVAGGGPAGSATAIWLARAGVDVMLLDRARFPREKACAEYCSPGVVDALADLGGLTQIHAREHRRLDGMNVVAHDQTIPLDFAADRRSDQQAIGIRRSVLDEELLELAAKSGVQIETGSRVVEPLVAGSTVVGARVRSDQGERRISSSFLVGADGIHSTVARSLGLDRPVRWPRRLGLVARFTDLPEPMLQGQMHIGDGAYCGMSPVSDDEVNVSLVVPMGAKRPGDPISTFFERTIRQLPGIDRLLGDARRVSRVRGVGPLAKRVRTTVGEGFLLVGDAAGFFDPLTGEGVHRSLIGGKLAASSIVTALERGESKPVGYRRARRRAFNDKHRVCQIIQLALMRRATLDYLSARAGERDEVLNPLRGILGDYRPARDAFRPAFLWGLLRP